ncbi:MAG: leucine-rich repeat domain-containing protein [Candidatus Thorarchaeota archaeon]
MNVRKEFKINNYLTVKLKDNKTIIYAGDEVFRQCKSLLLTIAKSSKIKNMDEIIEEASINENELLPPEIEFWGHCSNLQAWAENNYNTNLLDKRLAFPLLKILTELGDMNAKNQFRREIEKRLETGTTKTITYLISEGYADYIKWEDLVFLMLSFEEAESLITLKNTLKVNIEFRTQEDSYDLCYAVISNKHVVEIHLPDCDIINVPEEIRQFRHLETLDLRNNNIKKMPSWLEELKDLREIDLTANLISEIPSCLERTNIAYLYISECPIKKISKSLINLPSLRYLELHKDLLTEESLEVIDLLKKNNVSIKLW